MFRRRITPERVVAELVAAGAPGPDADAIVSALFRAGLAPGEAREWLFDANRAYPHDWPTELGGEVMTLKAGSRFLLEQGRADLLLAAAREFAAASEDERAIGRLFWGSVGDVRRLTGGDPAREAVIAEVARAIYGRVGDAEKVCHVAQTRLPGHGDRRIVDRLLDGEEEAVREELARGEIDPRALWRSGELIFTGW